MRMFLNSFQSNLDTVNFLAYYETKMNLRNKEGEICIGTKRDHIATLNHLKKWNGVNFFDDLNNRTAHQFDQYLQLKTQCKSINGRCGHHKNFKTYLNCARLEDQIKFNHPYDSFKIKTEMGRFQPLSKEQFLSFWALYKDPTMHPTQKKVLRAFLFACITGMRHSDIRRVNMDWIEGEFLEFTPYKTRRFGTKVKMPLIKEALDLLGDEMDEVGEYMFFKSISEQKGNEIINEISNTLGIKMKLCFQVARETFATLYMEHNGKLEVLSSFMGHTTIKMTQKYVKIMDQRKKQESTRISEFIKPTNFIRPDLPDQNG